MRVLLAAAAALSLCACATGYHAPGLTGGVSAQHLDATTVRITALGNGFTSADRVQNFAMRKAAEETLASGYDYFAIIGAQDRSTSGTVVTPGYAQTTGFGSANMYGNNIHGSYMSNTTYTAPQAFNYVRPGQALMIRLYKAGEQPQGAFRASEVLSYLVPPPKKK